MFGVLKGLKLTLKHALRPTFTVKYPNEKIEIAPRYRGALELIDVVNEGPDPIDRLKPPCTGKCPANLDIRAYLAKAAQGDYIGSYNVIKERCAIPGIVGRVCFHPCEDQGCRRRQEDAPLAINAVKRFVADHEFAAFKAGQVDRPKANLYRDKKVAIIGSGPAGLNCAYYLAKWGYPVTIFEREAVPGGMLKLGIPDYRLPPEVIDREVKEIEDLGVKMEYGKELGKDFVIDDLTGEMGYSAVFLAIGAFIPQRLDIPNEDGCGNVMAGEDYLRLVNLDLMDEVPKAKSVVVVGGGNTAMDCVRVAKRLGAEATIIYRRSRNEMPAAMMEIVAAEEEGIKFEYLSAPTQVVCQTGKVATGLQCVRMELGEPDSSGRRRPSPVEGSEFVIETDLVLSAISRKPDVECLVSRGHLPSSGVDIHESWCTVLVDKKFATSREGVFAGGDLVNGAATVVEAYADARAAADTMHEYLSGEKAPPVTERTTIPHKAGYTYSSREHMEEIPPESRLTNFDEVEKGYTPEELLREANRCLYCESEACIGCGICVKICPDLALSVNAGDKDGKRVVSKYDWYANRCSFCGLCAEYCPTGTLRHTTEFELTTYTNEELVWDKEKMLRHHDDNMSEAKNKGGAA